MKSKYILIPATFLFLVLSGNALAKKYDHKTNSHYDSSEARWKNSNQQSDEYSLRGRDRSEERHYSKKYKEKKEKKRKYKDKKYHDDDRYEKNHDRYEYQRDDDDRHEGKRDRYERQRYDD